MYEYQRICILMFTDFSMGSPGSSGLSSIDSSASLRGEALNKAMETPEITDLTFQGPQDQVQDRKDTRQAACPLARDCARTGPFFWPAPSSTGTETTNQGFSWLWTPRP